MKRIFSVFMTILMVLSLCTAAFAQGENATELTILFTGGIGEAVGGDGLSYAAAAALKDAHKKEAVLLVDAGGFNSAAADIMAAAGYDLAVAGKKLDDWAVPSIAMDVKDLKSGAMVEKGGLKIAFIAIAPIGEQKAEEYYASVQAAATAANEKGADYVMALGYVENAEELAKNVSGLSAILTYGQKEEDTVVVETTPVPVADEEPVVERTVIATVDEGFGSVGVLTISPALLLVETVDAKAYASRDLAEDEDIRALESAFEPAADEEEPADNAENGENDEPADNGETETGENNETEDNESAENGETGENAQTEETQQTAEAEQEASQTVEEGENAEGGENAENGENAEDEEKGEVIVEETAETVDQANASPTDATTESPAPEETVKPGPSTDSDAASNIIAWTKGTEDLKITLDHPVASVNVKGSKTTELESKYYTLSEDKKTVSIHADCLNGWAGDGSKFNFEFIFSDGAAAEVKTVSITGTAPTTAPAAPTTADVVWNKGTANLDFTLPGTVESVKVNGGTLDSKYYTLSADKKTVSVDAGTLSGWKAGKYNFEFSFSDGTAAVSKLVEIKGTNDSAAPAATDTPAPTPTPVPDAKNPATGDESPIAMLIIVMAVLLVAIVVVVILVVRKNKRN